MIFALAFVCYIFNSEWVIHVSQGLYTQVVGTWLHLLHVLCTYTLQVRLSRQALGIGREKLVVLTKDGTVAQCRPFFLYLMRILKPQTSFDV